jgi:serine/threonine-protein kinase
LPGSQAVVFTAYTGGLDSSNIEVLALKTRERKTIVRGGAHGRYVPSGHLIYLHQNTLMAAPFDLGKLLVSGPAQAVLEDVSALSSSSPGDFAVSGAPSGSGTLVYIGGKPDPPRAIFWLDSAGNTQPLHPAPGFYNCLRFSPDGKRLAFAIGDVLIKEDIWIQDLERNTTIRLTSLPGVNNSPLWSPDGKYILFQSRYQPNQGHYWIRADGAGEVQRLAEAGPSEIDHASSISPDGKRVAVQGGNPFTEMEVGTKPFEGVPEHPRLGKTEPFVRAPGFTMPAFSPDGHWLAYASGETGTAEVYVRPYPGPRGKWPISNGGGEFPIWSPNGRELFFRARDGRIMVADYSAKGDSFVAAKPRVWSEKKILLNRGGGPFMPYALAPDGKRFAVVLYTDGTSEQQSVLQLNFLLNFFDELRRRVPAGGK